MKSRKGGCRMASGAASYFLVMSQKPLVWVSSSVLEIVSMSFDSERPGSSTE